MVDMDLWGLLILAVGFDLVFIFSSVSSSHFIRGVIPADTHSRNLMHRSRYVNTG